MTGEYLIEADELYASLKDEDLFIIDTRDALEYNKAHIPGAVNISEFFTYLSTSGSGGHGAMVRHFKSWLGYAGLKRTQRVVTYEDAMDNGYGQSCRARFLLKFFGQPVVHVLHGGFRAWEAKELPMDNKEPEIKPINYEMHIDPTEMATTEDTLAAIEDPSITILDCRDRAEWLGVSTSPYSMDFCPRKGRIPRAVWIEWYSMMYRKDNISWFKSKEEILEIAKGVGITTESNVFIYCFKGARASNTLLALKLAGIIQIKNYFNAWNDWSRHPSLPIEEGYK